VAWLAPIVGSAEVSVVPHRDSATIGLEDAGHLVFVVPDVGRRCAGHLVDLLVANGAMKTSSEEACRRVRHYSPCAEDVSEHDAVTQLGVSRYSEAQVVFSSIRSL